MSKVTTSVEVTREEMDAKVKALLSAKSVAPGYIDRLEAIEKADAESTAEIKARFAAELKEFRAKNRELFNGVWAEIASAIGFEGNTEGKLSLYRTDAGEEIVALESEISDLFDGVRMKDCECENCKARNAFGRLFDQFFGAAPVVSVADGASPQELGHAVAESIGAVLADTLGARNKTH